MTTYPEQRSSSGEQGSGATPKPTGDEVYSSSGGSAGPPRDTPSFEEATRSRGQQDELVSGWTAPLATLVGLFAVGSLIGFLIWRD